MTLRCVDDLTKSRLVARRPCEGRRVRQRPECCERSRIVNGQIKVEFEIAPCVQSGGVNDTEVRSVEHE